MVVEANRDAWKECVVRANEALVANDLSKAKRLLYKAQKLDPSFDVNSYLTSKGYGDDQTHSETNYDHYEDHYDDADSIKQRRKRFGNANSTSKESASLKDHNSRGDPQGNASREKTRSRSRSRTKPANSQADSEGTYHVERIKHCKDYYEILQVSHDCTDIQLKKKYRELALKLHPDKCEAPGATEAFKALGNAYTVLSDVGKRDAYDKSGRNPQRMNAGRSGFYDYDVNRGFESEVTPEEIFEMFFGGGFPGGTVYRRNRHFTRHEEVHEERSTIASLFQLLPLLILLFGAMFMQLLVGDPAFSLRAENGYTVQRHTRDLKVPYFVRPDFLSKHGDRIYHVEVQVEEEHVNRLRMNCYREKNNRETTLWRAKMMQDKQLWAQAQDMQMPNCKKLEELYN